MPYDAQCPPPASLPRTIIGGLSVVASMGGSAVGAYHGYKRNESVGWAIAWAFLGSVAPFIAIPVALAQGIGEKKK